MDEFKLNLYDKEVFVFTPNGDLHNYKGATALDLLFPSIRHWVQVCRCQGEWEKYDHQVRPDNGDQVEVLTSPTRNPAGMASYCYDFKAKTKYGRH